MIEELDLRRELKNTGTLMNYPVKTEFATEVYNRIAHRFILDDLKKALTDLLESEARLTYPTLHKRLLSAKSQRVEAEENKNKLLNRDTRTACPEILKMVKAVQEGDKAALEKYGMGKPLMQGHNLAVVMDSRGGSRRRVWIDPKDPDLAAFDLVRNERGYSETLVDLRDIAEAKIIDNRPPIEEMYTETVVRHDDDFIPELDGAE